ncbi:SurA N-terminal domain-containing protein [Acetobacter sp. AN02]|uniref:peptidylprolyl isomerase n=1 Tax=Acetobacter sp. AN02 TaxID=2894186 RepID=UPI00243422A3|nr:peptidylprolyl isomerase [Acetobacter sp. AN02]MDG6095178.1 SurA N-terminal domain-containing protein [Acetobacter sp. AN02]
MISLLRRFVVDSWAGRILAAVLFLAFVGWGVGDILTGISEKGDVAAYVGSRQVTTAELTTALRQQLPGMAQRLGVPGPEQIPQMFRAGIVRDVLNGLIGQKQLLEAARRYGITVPDDVIRDEIFSLPVFHGPDGRFDRSRFNSYLSQQNLTENRFLDIMRDELTVRAMLGPVSGAARVSRLAITRIYGWETETRVADVLRIPFASQEAPADPDEAVLRRFYSNHPWLFRTREYRHAKIVVLSPETVARVLSVSDDTLHKLYDEQSSRYHVPELRSLQMVTANDEAAAQAIATLWKGGADWAQVRDQAKGLVAVEFPDARSATLPDRALQKAVFGAALNDVTGPVKTGTGQVVFRVTKITPPHDTSFDQAKEDLRRQVTEVGAPEAMAQNARKLQDVIAGGDLDSIPTDLGAAAASGFLDAAGLTKEGEPAPMPGSEAIRKAVTAQIFAQKKGAPAVLTEVPGKPGKPSEGWFAVSVDEIEPGKLPPFDEVRIRVLAAWRDAQMQHEANVKATGLYIAAKEKGGIAAVAPAGAEVSKGVMVSRSRESAGIPADLAAQIQNMPAGVSFMGEDSGNYIVVTVTRIVHPEAKDDIIGMNQIRDGMTGSLSDDVLEAFVRTLSDVAKPKIISRGVEIAQNQAGLGDGDHE